MGGGPITFLTSRKVGDGRFRAGPTLPRYFLKEPGKYTIQAQRYDDQSKTLVKSNIITVTVTQ